MGRLALTEPMSTGGRPGHGNDGLRNPEGAPEKARSQLEMSILSLPEVILVRKRRQGEHWRTRINRTAIPHPDERQVIGRPSVDARFVIAVDIDS